MKARIYEIKGGALGNADVLRDEENNRFFWNDEKFTDFQIGDHIFFVNKARGWTLYTTIGEKDITTTRNPTTAKTTFNHDGKTYVVDDPTDRFKRFVRFDIIQQATIGPGDSWSSLGSSEVNDLWLDNRPIEPSPNRQVRVEQLKSIFKSGDAHALLTDIEGKLSSGSQPIDGLVVVDGGDWFDEAMQAQREAGHIVLWWSKRPSEVEVTMAKLRQTLQRKGFFALYYTAERSARYRARIIDFATEDDYSGKQWGSNRKVAWLQDQFKEYKGESRKGKMQQARIVFLVDRMEQLSPPIPVADFVFVRSSEGLTQDNMLPYISIKNEPAWQAARTTVARTTNPSVMSTMKFSDAHRSVLCAIKTKPFILLAGISGTGKSRLVRTLAYQTCSVKELQGKLPGNYALIMVKPNWHDPTELIGYVSRIGEKPRYVVTEFLRFVVKAWQYPQVPFFLCLDEMNLAPVEQYFADFLSVVETRRKGDDGTVISDAILTAQNSDGVEVFGAALDELGLSESAELRQRFLQEGITLPPNLVVMGTVNMDETTHSFSRKVLDRAMTFEMNEVDLRAGLGDKDGDWSYPDAPMSLAGAVEQLTRGGDVPKNFDGYEAVLKWLEQMNGVLNGTPFKVAYRVRDEYLIYAYHNSLLANKPNDWLAQCMDELLVMKVLSRIEGDEGRVGEVLKNLLALLPVAWVRSKKKLEEMQGKLAFGYTSFWS
jgi:energy-coupling factor transporter ATP-binding protein EcfA2